MAGLSGQDTILAGTLQDVLNVLKHNENQPKTMKNHKITLKNNENQPKTMKQPEKP